LDGFIVLCTAGASCCLYCGEKQAENTSTPLLDKHRSEKIRRQYFNVLLMVFAAVALMLFTAQVAAGKTTI